ncbi:RNA polymerase-binding protein RbpA [Propionimicrobium lymphophilum]|uniref:RNA polymerase-binding protein RbpA n=1 Tax=Propionimicrobium lymphophilum TaxID=33012 RepID=UPI0023F2B164|nr:RNA polymerase-binding protein RbpA [Propionimicrobium lymphophilum]
MSSGIAIRGSRIGGSASSEYERGDAAPRMRISYYCANGHETKPAFAVGADIPEEWECTKCGLPAGKDKQNTPARPHTQVYKSHLDYVKERRSADEAKQILGDALSMLRARRAAGEVIY